MIPMIVNAQKDAVLARKRLHFSTALKSAIAKRRIGQADLVRISGLSKSVVSQYFTMKSSPTPQSLNKLAAALNVTTGSLWPEDEASLVTIAAERAESNSFTMSTVQGQPENVDLTMSMVIPRNLGLRIMQMLSDEALVSNDNGAVDRK